MQAWLKKCRSLNCTSEYECFLRRPKTNCPQCKHTPDCSLTTGLVLNKITKNHTSRWESKDSNNLLVHTEDELISKYCRGWICPREQKCTVQIVGSCKGFDCIIERSCRASSNSSVTYMKDEVINFFITHTSSLYLKNLLILL